MGSVFLTEVTGRARQPERTARRLVNTNENHYHLIMSTHPQTAATEDPPRRSPIRIQEIMQNAREVEISHEGQIEVRDDAILVEVG